MKQLARYDFFDSDERSLPVELLVFAASGRLCFVIRIRSRVVKEENINLCKALKEIDTLAGGSRSSKLFFASHSKSELL